MLMKPKRWLAYTIEVNDLLPTYDQIIDRFERSDIPLDGAFGSNTTPGQVLPGLLIAIGAAVEPARLSEVLSLLDGLGQLFLLVRDEGEHDKCVAIGALNLNSAPVVAVTGEIHATIMRPSATTAELHRTINAAPKVHLLAGRQATDDEH